jgi:NAD(P)-dependent dehydrogenase (short-subunit alcohol dehydrogenase family)
VSPHTPTPTSLNARTALVTGGGQGLGQAIAEALAQAGATVIVSDINTDHGEATAKIIADAGGHATFRPCDVTDTAAVHDLIAGIKKDHGRLDCAVNNAGVEGAIAPIIDYPLDAFDHVLNLNVRALFVCMQEELRVMIGQRGGSIVNISSIAGFAGFPNFSAYNASKHAVVGLTRTAALETATDGVRVNAVAPGFCVTPMVTDRGLKAQPGSPEYQQIEQLHPMNRLGRPAEIAQAVAWLCSDAASFVTGHSLAADGGYLAR